MQLPTSFSVTEENMSLWKNDPRYAEYTKIKEEYSAEIYETVATEGKKKKFSDWNPIIKSHDKNISDLQKQFHPALLKNQRLFKINDVGMDIINTSFLYATKIEEELPNAKLAGRFLSFHSNNFYLFFIPSIHEVLTQIPQNIADLEGDFYFSTETISADANECSIGSWNKFHIALTSIYRA